VEVIDPSLENFPRAYVPPRKPTAKQVRLQKEANYDLVTPLIPPKVVVEKDMLGMAGNLIFSDQNLAYLKNFLELAQKNYLRTSLRPDSLIITVVLQEWAIGLQKIDTLNMLEIPHFGRSA